jgi:hypothetical protein
MRHCVILLHRGIQSQTIGLPKTDDRVDAGRRLCGDRRYPLHSSQFKFIKPLPLASNSQEVHRQFFAV